MYIYYNIVKNLSIYHLTVDFYYAQMYNETVNIRRKGRNSMFCSKCGTQLPEGTSVCPKCSQTETVPAGQKENKKIFNAPGKGAKSYAAIFTALLVFPASICTAIDLVFDKYDYWFGYVVGALIVTWVISVLPVLKITPPVVTGVICFASIILYVAYIAGKTGHLNWLSKFLLPMLILTAAFIAMDSALIGGKKVKGIHILSLLSAEAAAFFICLEATLDNWAVGSVDLKWSLIIACGFISVIAVFEAFSYVGRINRK